MILFCYFTELKAITHELVNLESCMLQLQIASCRSALRGFLYLVSFTALPNCFSLPNWWEQKDNAMLSSLEGYRRKTILALLSLSQNQLSVSWYAALRMQCSA